MSAYRFGRLSPSASDVCIVSRPRPDLEIPLLVLFPCAGSAVPRKAVAAFGGDAEARRLAAQLCDRATLRLLRPLLHMGATLVVNRVSRLVADPTQAGNADRCGPWHDTVDDTARGLLDRHGCCRILDVRGFSTDPGVGPRPGPNPPAVCLGTHRTGSPGEWIDWFRDLAGQTLRFAPATRLLGVDDPFPGDTPAGGLGDDPRVQAMVLNVMWEAIRRPRRRDEGPPEHLAGALRRFARVAAEGVARDAGIDRRPLAPEAAVAAVQQALRGDSAAPPLALELVLDGDSGPFTFRESYGHGRFTPYWNQEGLRGHWLVNIHAGTRIDGFRAGQRSWLVDKWTGEVSSVDKLVHRGW